MAHHRQLVVVESGALEAGVVQREAERPDQVQARAGIGAKADDVAGVWGYFGLEQNHIQHRHASPCRNLRRSESQC
jgi:hypothetical protein